MSDAAPPPSLADTADAPVAEEEQEGDGLALVGETMAHDLPRRRRRWLLVLLIAALAVPAVVCVGAASSFSRFVHRDPPPDLEAPAVVAAHDDAVRRTGAAVSAVAPLGATSTAVARFDACYRGSRRLNAWDDYDWVCATRSTAVLSLPIADLRATLHGERDRLRSAGWRVAADHLNSFVGPTAPSSAPSPDVADRPQARSWNAVELDRHKTRLALSYGPADAEFVGACLRHQRVEVTSYAGANWEIGSPGLDRNALDAARRPATVLVVVTAQHVWFAN